MAKRNQTEQREQIISMHDAGATYDEIQAETGASRATIAKWVKGKQATHGKVKLNRKELAGLKRTLKALPVEQIDEAMASTELLADLVGLVAQIVGSTEVAGPLVAAARARGKWGASLARAVERAAKAAPPQQPLEPAEAIQQQVTALHEAIVAANRSGDVRTFATLSRLLPGLHRTLLKYLPPPPPSSDEDPDMILAATAAVEKLQQLVTIAVAAAEA